MIKLVYCTFTMLMSAWVENKMFPGRGGTSKSCINTIFSNPFSEGVCSDRHTTLAVRSFGCLGCKSLNENGS